VSPFEFSLRAADGAARLGTLTTPHGTIAIPAPPAIVVGETVAHGRVPALGEHTAAIQEEFA